MSNEAFDAVVSLIQQQREASIRATATFGEQPAHAFA